jgi:ABC-2 type transport system permease protein
MNRRTLFVAWREFRQIAGARSFWVTLLILPLAFGLGQAMTRFGEAPAGRMVLVADPLGRESAAIAAAMALEADRAALVALARYVRRHDLAAADPGAPWSAPRGWYPDEEVRRFRAEGGVPAALAKIRPRLKPETPPFRAPAPEFRLEPAGAALLQGPPAALGARLEERLQIPDARGRTGGPTQALEAAVYVPPDFGDGRAPVMVWTRASPDPALISLLRSVLTRDLRTGLMRRYGVPALAAEALASAEAPLVVASPPPGGGRERLMIRSILPIAAAYLLLTSLMISGSWMLQSLIEERSNKLLETVLACVSPGELMVGKLVGGVGVGLMMVAVWVGCAVLAAYATRGEIADLVRPALAPLAHPAVAAAMLYYFLPGYLMISLLFMTIGAMSDSLREAQGYLTPLILLIALPFALLAQAVLRDPSGLVPRVMTWIPLYTPFAMLARLGAGAPLSEVVLAGLMLALFVALETFALGRIFQASLLHTGQRRSLADLVRLIAAAPRARTDARP